jgi:hypothetical protein
MPEREKNVQAEMDALQLEEMRYRIQEMRGRQNTREIRRRSIEESLRAERESRAQIQALCFHKKGGMGVESLMQGNDSHYAVAKFILPTGPQIVICMRCFKLWTPPDPIPRNASKDEVRDYLLKVKEYQEAVAFPTDNTTGGSQIYLVRDNQTAA